MSSNLDSFIDDQETGIQMFNGIAVSRGFVSARAYVFRPLNSEAVSEVNINPEDVESGKIQVEGFIIKDLCEEPSNWRSSMSLREYLTSNGIVSMQGIDTRALTRKLRVSGVMMGAMSTELTTSELKNALETAPN